MKQKRNRLHWWIAYHLPKKLAYYVGVRVLTWASTQEPYAKIELPRLPGADALKAWYEAYVQIGGEG